MAAEVIKTVKSSGGDYTSLSAWEAGEQGDLPTLDEIHIAECYNFEDTVTVLLSGWTTDATRYIEIRTPASERHDGTPGTGYRLAVSSYAIRTYEDYVRIYGIEASMPSQNNYLMYIHTAAAGEIRVAYCLLHGGARGIDDRSGGSGHYFYNNIIFDCLQGIVSNGSNSTYIYNNTIVDAERGLYMLGTATNKIAKNNLVDNPSIEAYAGVFDPTSDYNASSTSDTTGGANDRASQTFTFANAAGNDYHLASNDAGAKDYGVSDPGSGLFSDDIDGDTRSGSWDIGADEYVSGGPTIFPDMWHPKTESPYPEKIEVVGY